MPVPTPSPLRYASIEDLLSDWLKTVVGYPNVAHELPTNLTFLMPLVVVERIGGGDATHTIDVANVDIDVFGPDRVTAKAHAEHIRQAVRLQLPGYKTDDTVIAKVETISAPAHVAFDSKHRVRRFTAAYRIHAHKYIGM